jgi:hypothetical protein
MNTSTKSTRISAVFLSAVLIAGTIAALFPSFMIGAQADPYYGMDKDYKKVDKKISVSSLKCNNINVNVNGLTLDVFPPSLGILGGGDVAAEAADPTTDVASFAGSGGSDKSEFNNFKFICINNNNNTVIAAEEPLPPVPPEEECEDCFDEIPNLTFPITVDLPNLQIVIDDFEELCDLIFSPPFSESAEQLLRLVEAIAPTGTPQETIDDVVCNCLVPLLGIQGACPPGPSEP